MRTRRLETKTQAVQTLACESRKDQSTDTPIGVLKISHTNQDSAQQTDEAVPPTVQKSVASGEEAPAVETRRHEILDFDIDQFSVPFVKRSSSLASVSTLTHELQPDSDRNSQKEVHESVTDINGLCNILRSSKERERVLCLEQRLREAQYELESQHFNNLKVVRKLEHDLKQRNINLVCLTSEHHKLAKDLEASRKEISRVVNENASKCNVLEERLKETKRDMNTQLLESERLLRSARQRHQDEIKTLETEMQKLRQSKEELRRENEALKEKATEEHDALMAARHVISELKQEIRLEEQLRAQAAESQCEIRSLRAKIAALSASEPTQVTGECMDVDELKSWYASEMRELKETIQVD
ncbi:hypothetical protein AAHC03_09840 [Spirometra sp. Aus1]